MKKEMLSELKPIKIIGSAPLNTKCVICKNLFSEENPSSLEHIFPESIGGKLTCNYLYCKRCNSTLGQRFDKELFENFQYAATVLDVKRSAGNPLPNMRLKTYGRKEFILKPGGRLELHSLVEEEIKDGKKSIIVRGNSEEEVLKRAKGISQSLSKKGKTFNLSEFKKLDSTLVYQEELNNFRLNLATGKHDTHVSVLKTAFTYALSQNIPLAFMDHIPMILRNEKNCYGAVIPYIYPPLSPIPLTREKVNHSVLLIGLPEDKALFAIVELFSSFRYCAILSTRYEGLAMKSFVSQCCTTGEITNEPEFPLELEKYVQTQYFTKEALIEAFREDIKPLNILISRISYSHLIGKTLDFDFGPFNKGQLVTENDIEDFLQNMPKPEAVIDFIRLNDPKEKLN